MPEVPNEQYGFTWGASGGPRGPMTFNSYTKTQSLSASTPGRYDILVHAWKLVNGKWLLIAKASLPFTIEKAASAPPTGDNFRPREAWPLRDADRGVSRKEICPDGRTPSGSHRGGRGRNTLHPLICAAIVAAAAVLAYLNSFQGCLSARRLQGAPVGPGGAVLGGLVVRSWGGGSGPCSSSAMRSTGRRASGSSAFTW
ncbi:MAG: hypothetical protein MZU97_07745 [Bacillus subtilis]|nr:hypothetical protein [Bacillus subtilis]